MSNKVFSTLTSAISVIKGFRLERLVVVVLATVLVVVTTACQPNSPSEVGTGSYHERVNQPTGLREYTDRPDGQRRPDMSSLRDNDYRDSGAADARAKDVSERAEQHIGKVQSPGDFAESYREGKPLNERVGDLSKDVGGAATQFKEDFSQGAQENLSNLRSNFEKAGENMQQTAKGAQESTRDQAQKAANTVRDRA